MYNKFLNFYLPQTTGYALAGGVAYYSSIVSFMGIFVLILMFIFRKKHELKTNIIRAYFIVAFLVQIYSIFAYYSSFKVNEQNLSFWANISFVLFFGLIFLVYYIPVLAVLLIDYIINQTLIGNKGGKE